MKKKSSEKSFGLLFSFIFLIIAIWPIVFLNSLRIWAFVISIILFSISFAKPSLLKPFNTVWIRFGELLGSIIAPIVMLLVYFLILTPISLIVRVFGKDLLNLKFSNKNSYWIKREKNSESMDKQF